MIGMAEPPPRRRTAFEVTVAVLLLVMLIALIAPHVGGASGDARQAALLANLQKIRACLEVYRAQHRDCYPDEGFIRQMLAYSNADGETSNVASSDYPLGPYLQSIPGNSFSGICTVRIVNTPGLRHLPPQQDAGWWYNAATGEFRADLTDLHALPNGMVLNQL
jgi:type II secretory pathway pseudopilin PulG